MTPKEVLELGKKHEVKFVDLKFIDFPGVWQHTTIPATRLNEGLFEDGLAFDGSSIRGWQPINAPDMIMIPDADAARRLLDLRPHHQAALLARPEAHRQEGRGLPPPDRHRRHVVHGPRG